MKPTNGPQPPGEATLPPPVVQPTLQLDNASSQYPKYWYSLSTSCISSFGKKAASKWPCLASGGARNVYDNAARYVELPPIHDLGLMIASLWILYTVQNIFQWDSFEILSNQERLNWKIISVSRTTENPDENTLQMDTKEIELEKDNRGFYLYNNVYLFLNLYIYLNSAHIHIFVTCYS